MVIMTWTADPRLDVEDQDYSAIPTMQVKTNVASYSERCKYLRKQFIYIPRLEIMAP